MPKTKYGVYVGNIGRVYEGDIKMEAETIFREYVKMSKMPYGRASGEDVTLFHNNEILREHVAELSKSEIEGEDLPDWYG